MPAQHYTEPTPKDKFISNALLFTVLVIIVFSGFFILEEYGFFLWLLIVIIAVFSLTAWHSSSYGYKCLHCGHEFSISFWQDLPSLNSMFFRKKMLKCPECKYMDYAAELVREK